MELQHLREFVHLSNSMNFTMTAKELHLTQPTLSKHMALLEKELEVKLFERSHTKVELTEEGFFFLGVASNLIWQMEEAKATLTQMRQKVPIVLDGKLDDPLVSSIVLLASTECAKQNKVSVVFNHNTSKTPFTLLLDGAIDILIDLMPQGKFKQNEVASQPLLSRSFVALMDSRNPLASKDILEIRDLKNSTLVQLLWEEYAFSGWEIIEEACLRNGFHPKKKQLPIRSLAESVTTMPNDCVLIHSVAVAELIQPSDRVLRYFSDDDAFFPICANYLRSSEEKLRPFLDALNVAAVQLVV